MSELWQRLKAVRSFANKRQEDIAKICGVSRGAVAQWESKDPNNRTRPNIDQVQAISRTTNVPVEWILNDQVDPSDVWRIGRDYVVESVAPPAAHLPPGFVLENRVGEAFKKAVEYAMHQLDPDLVQGFDVPVGRGLVAAMADFCCCRTVAQLVTSLDECMDPDVAGRLLLLERATGKPMAKLVICCDPAADQELCGAFREQMQAAFDIKVIKVNDPAEAAQALAAACRNR